MLLFSAFQSNNLARVPAPATDVACVSALTATNTRIDVGTAQHGLIVGCALFPSSSSVPDASSTKRVCVCDAGFEDSDCGTVSPAGASSNPPSFIGTIVLLLLLVVCVERSVWLYRKKCGNFDGGQDTTGFSRIGTTALDEHDEQFDHEPFGDERINERL